MTIETAPFRTAYLTLLDALRAAQASADAAETAWQDCEHEPDEACAHKAEADVALARVHTAEAALAVVRDALLESDEPCEYTIRDVDSGARHVVMAAGDEAARDAARAWTRSVSWDTSSGTLFVAVTISRETDDGYVSGRGSDQEERLTVAVDPEAPACSSSEGHHWARPHEIVGGLEENPGVRGHGGGVITTECCVRCGCARVTDGWATDPTTGKQGRAARAAVTSRRSSPTRSHHVSSPAATTSTSARPPPRASSHRSDPVQVQPMTRYRRGRDGGCVAPDSSRRSDHRALVPHRADSSSAFVARGPRHTPA